MNEVDVASLDSSIVIVEKLLFSSSFFSSILEQLAGTEQTDSVHQGTCSGDSRVD